MVNPIGIKVKENLRAAHATYSETWEMRKPAGDGIAGNRIADDGTQRQMGQGSDLRVSAVSVATTRRGNLLIASGHVVYNQVNPADAPTVKVIQLGSPLNFFGGPWGAVQTP